MAVANAQGSPRPTAPTDRRDAILKAALRSFTRSGYGATSIEGIRRDSGASIGSIYHHFGGKQELFGALYLEGLSHYQDGMVAVLRRSRQAGVGIRSVVHHHLDWIVANPDLGAFLLTGGEGEVRLASRARLRELNRGFFGEVGSWLAPQIEAGHIRRLPLDLFHALLLGPSQEFSRSWLAGRTRTSPTAAKRTLANAAWGALRADHQEDV